MILYTIIYFILNYIVIIFTKYIRTIYSNKEVIIINSFADFINTRILITNFNNIHFNTAFNIILLNYIICYYNQLILNDLSYKYLLILKSFKFIFITKNGSNTFIMINNIISGVSLYFLINVINYKNIINIFTLIVLECLYFYKQNIVILINSSDINTLNNYIAFNKCILLFGYDITFFLNYCVVSYVLLLFITYNIKEKLANNFLIYDKLSLFNYLSLIQCIYSEMNYNNILINQNV